jgi:hypothetical protein
VIQITQIQTLGNIINCCSRTYNRTAVTISISVVRSVLHRTENTSEIQRTCVGEHGKTVKVIHPVVYPSPYLSVCGCCLNCDVICTYSLDFSEIRGVYRGTYFTRTEPNYNLLFSCRKLLACIQPSPEILIYLSQKWRKIPLQCVVFR